MPNLATGVRLATQLATYADGAAAACGPEQRRESIVCMAMTNTLSCEQLDGRHVGSSLSVSDISTAGTQQHFKRRHYLGLCTKSAPTAMLMAGVALPAVGARQHAH